MAHLLITSLADEVAVGAGSVQFGTLLMTTTGVVGQNRYQYVANVASWIAQGSNPTATAGAGSTYVPAGVIVLLDGHLGAKLAVIQDGSGGKASLTPVQVV